MILMPLCLSLNKKKYIKYFVDERLEKITDNALGNINKIRDGKKDLASVKKNQEKFKYYLGEIKKVLKNQKNKKTQYTILKCSIKQGMKLLNFMMIIH